MYPVTTDFLDKMKADRRQVFARVAIDYTDPFMDQSLTIEASEQANVSYPQQTADSVDQTTHKWASLDGSWVLDGTYHLAPPPEKLAQYQFGWWGLQHAGAGGVFLSPYPSLTVAHLPRPIHALRVVGDTARVEYPVDFTIKLYAQDDTLLKTETVTGNDQVSWSKALEPQVVDVAKQVLTITKWSHEGRCAKIIEFFTSIREVYETGDLVSIRLLEEREASQGSIAFVPNSYLQPGVFTVPMQIRRTTRILKKSYAVIRLVRHQAPKQISPKGSCSLRLQIGTYFF